MSNTYLSSNTKKSGPANSIRRAAPGLLPSERVFRLDTARTRKVKKEKEKKMGWFRKKFNRWVRQAWEDSAEKTESVGPSPHPSIDAKTSVRFTIYPASGGYIIEHYRYDRFKDGDGPSLTIINNGDSIGTAVEHILAVEALKA